MEVVSAGIEFLQPPILSLLLSQRARSRQAKCKVSVKKSKTHKFSWKLVQPFKQTSHHIEWTTSFFVVHRWCGEHHVAISTHKSYIVINLKKFTYITPHFFPTNTDDRINRTELNFITLKSVQLIWAYCPLLSNMKYIDNLMTALKAF